MSTAFGIAGVLLLAGGLLGLVASTTALGQVQSSITVLIAVVLLVGAAVTSLLADLRKQSKPPGD